MNTEVANYDFHGSAVRIHTDGDTVEYCARDIAATLGYTNTSKAISDHCRGVTNRYPIVDSLGRTQEATFISEGDVYRLIVSSQLPAAVEFEHWLFDEVVPQIRRTGGYIPVQAADDEKSILARAVLIAQNTISEKDKIIEAQRSHIEQTEPLAKTALAFTAANGTIEHPRRRTPVQPTRPIHDPHPCLPAVARRRVCRTALMRTNGQSHPPRLPQTQNRCSP